MKARVGAWRACSTTSASAVRTTTFPGAEVVVLDDSGHWPMIDDPDAVERAVTGFLRRHVAAGQ